MRDPTLSIELTVLMLLSYKYRIQREYNTIDDVELVLEKTPIGWYNLTLFSEGQKDDNNVTLEDV